MTDSARYADMVLPIAQWFELEEVANAGQCSSLHYSEKAIDPLYESKPDPQIVTELAQKLGLGDYFKLDNGGILEEMYDTDMGKALGMDMGNLREKKADTLHSRRCGDGSPYRVCGWEIRHGIGSLRVLSRDADASRGHYQDAYS